MWLAVDTSTSMMSVALWQKDEVWAEQVLPLGRSMLARGAEVIDRFLSDAGVIRDQLHGLAVGTGPGSYTGLRVGIGLMQGLALSLGLPLVGVKTSRVLAAALYGFDRVVVTQYSGPRTGHIALSIYNTSQFPPEEVQPPILVKADELGSHLAMDCQIVGDAAPQAMVAEENDDLACLHIASPIFSVPRAGFLASIAFHLWEAGRGGDPAELQGVYLTKPPIPKRG